MFKFIEHTADMGLEATAGSIGSVAEQMAQGLACMIYGECPVDIQLSSDLVVCAEDPAELLVAWLSEVLYWCEQDNLVPGKFEVVEAGRCNWHTTISGEPFDPARHAVERQVKSVTYHQACLEQTDNGWYARVYVDL